MELLHKPYAGLSKMLTTARKHYYWPHMKNDLANLINKCENCQELWPSLPKDNPIETIVKFPMEKLSIDPFEIRGKHFLLAVDRFSSLPWVRPLHSLTMDAITTNLNKIFHEYSYPRSIHSDGGPQFHCEFSIFCYSHGIIHEKASPFNARSNSQAEVNVRILKEIILKMTLATFEEAFSEWKNTERVGKPSPKTFVFWKKPPSAAANIGYEATSYRKPEATSRRSLETTSYKHPRMDARPNW